MEIFNVLAEAVLCYLDDYSLKAEKALEEALTAYREGKNG